MPYGLGIGCGFQTSYSSPQTVLSRADVPLGMAVMFLVQQIGGSVFSTVGQNSFYSQFVDSLSLESLTLTPKLSSMPVLLLYAASSPKRAEHCCQRVQSRFYPSVHLDCHAQRLHDLRRVGCGMEEHEGEG